MDTNTALFLTIGMPTTALAIAAGIAAKYNSQVQKVKSRRSNIHPIALIYRQINGLDLKDDDELEVDDLKKQIVDLQRQLNNLRDTATQYDLSIDHQLQDLNARVQSIERSGLRHAPSQQPENQPRNVGLGSG